MQAASWEFGSRLPDSITMIPLPRPEKTLSPSTDALVVPMFQVVPGSKGPMASKPRKSQSSADADRPAPAAAPPLPLPEVLSFLKETRGVPSWTVQDLARSLKVSTAVAKGVLPVLQAQGYIEPSEAGDWLTTAAGDMVAGSKPPRFTPEAVSAALSDLADRIKAMNQDRSARFRITEAVAFGDFLTGRARVQAPDVGVELTPRDPAREGEPGSAVEEAAKRAVLRQLKGKGTTLNLRAYEDWMSSRTPPQAAVAPPLAAARRRTANRRCSILILKAAKP